MKRSAMLAMVMVLGCSGEMAEVTEVAESPIEPEPPPPPPPGYATNGYATNGYATNGLRSGTFGSRPLDVLASMSLPAAASAQLVRLALNDESAREALKYIVSCALNPAQTVTFSSQNGQWSSTIRGMLGASPGWIGGPCDEACQEWTSACVGARLNGNGRMMLVSLRAPFGSVLPGSSLTPISPVEKANFPAYESVFWGNLWEDQAVIRACAAGPDPEAVFALKMRLCPTDPSQCNPIVIGGCGEGGAVPGQPCGTCKAGLDVNRVVTECENDLLYCQAPMRPRSQRLVSAYVEPAPCAHKDYKQGVALDPECSPCAAYVAWRRPSCATASWDATCVTIARTECSGHNVVTATPSLAPLKLGSSDAVSDTCAKVGASACCTTAWHAGCAAIAAGLF